MRFSYSKNPYCKMENDLKNAFAIIQLYEVPKCVWK